MRLGKRQAQPASEEPLSDETPAESMDAASPPQPETETLDAESGAVDTDAGSPEPRVEDVATRTEPRETVEDSTVREANSADSAHADDLDERVAAGFKAMSDQMAELTDLISRRLLNDRIRQQALDGLYEQMEFAKDGLAREYLRPMVLELLLVIDRIDRINSVEGTSESMTSLRVELRDVLARRGVEEVSASGRFDPALHDAVSTAPATPEVGAGFVVSTVRAGYRHGDSVIRPARVVVAVEPPKEATLNAGSDSTSDTETPAEVGSGGGGEDG